MSKRKVSPQKIQGRKPKKKQKKDDPVPKTQATLITSNGIVGVSKFMVKSQTNERINRNITLIPNEVQSSHENKNKLLNNMNLSSLPSFPLFPIPFIQVKGENKTEIEKKEKDDMVMSDYLSQYSEGKTFNFAPNKKENQEETQVALHQENFMIINSKVELSNENKVAPSNPKFCFTTLPTSSSTDKKENKKKKRVYANPLKNEFKDNERKDRTICLSLHHSLNPERTEEEKKFFISKITELVHTFSRLRHETSLYANYVALCSIENPKSFPLSLSQDNLPLFFYHCMDRVMGINLKTRKSKKEKKKDKKEIAKEIDKANEMKTLNKLNWPRTSNGYNGLPDYQIALTDLKRLKDSIANQMTTMTHNSFFLSFFQRQKNALLTLYSIKITWKIIRCINSKLDELSSILSTWEKNFKKKEERNQIKPSKKLQKSLEEDKEILELFQESKETSVVWKLIFEHRTIINRENKKITQTYLKTHEHFVLSYYVHLMKMIETERIKRIDLHEKSNQSVDSQEKDSGDDKKKIIYKRKLKSFSLLPIHGYSPLSLPLDSSRFATFIKWLIKRNGWKKTWKALPTNRNLWWKHWFNLDDNKVIRNSKDSVFAGSITTNGVKVSFLFSSQKIPTIQEEKRQQDDLLHKAQLKSKSKKKIKEEKKKSKKVTMAKKEEKIYLTKAQKANERSNVLLEWQLNEFPQAVYEKRFHNIQGVDPGGINIVTIFDLKTQQVRCFTKRRYYHECKMNVVQKRAKYHVHKECEINPKFKKAFEISTKHSWKVPNSKEFLSRWKNHIPYENAMWAFYGKKMWSKWKFLTYQWKQKTLDSICRLITNTEKGVKSNEEILVGYGAARFKTSMKGQKPGPLSCITRHLATKPHVTIVMIDEFNTSQTCTKADTDEKNCLEKLKKYRSTRTERKRKKEGKKDTKIEEKKISIQRERKEKEKSDRKLQRRSKLENTLYQQRRRKKVQYAKRLKYDYSVVTNKPVYSILTCPSCKKCANRDEIASENISRITYLLSKKQFRPLPFLRKQEESSEHEDIHKYMEEVHTEEESNSEELSSPLIGFNTPEIV